MHGGQAIGADDIMIMIKKCYTAQSYKVKKADCALQVNSEQ